MQFKLDSDEDYELCSDLSQSNYVSSGFAEYKDKMDGLKRVDSRRTDAQEETKDYDQDAAKPDGE